MDRQESGTTYEHGSTPRGRSPGGETESVIGQVFEAFNLHRVELLQAIVTDDVRWTSVPVGQTLSGLDGTRAFMEGLIVPFPDVRLEITEILCEGERAAVEYVARGHHGGPFTFPDGSRIPPTGHPLELRFSEWFEVRGGRLAEARVYFDVGTLLRQLGVERLH